MLTKLISIKNELKVTMKKNLRFFFLFFVAIALSSIISSNTIAGELEDKAREHVVKYYLKDIFSDLKIQIKQKIISDVNLANIEIEPKELDVIASVIAKSTTSAFEDFIPDIATQLLMKYYTIKDIDGLNKIYANTSDDGLSFARKNYYFNRELNIIIMNYLYNNIDQIIEQELNIVLEVD